MVMVAFILTPVLVLPVKVQAVSVAELQAQINALLKQVEALQAQLKTESEGGSTSEPMLVCALTKNWGISPIENKEVLILRAYLNRVYATTRSFTPLKTDSAIFNPDVLNTLARYQAQYGISPANGYLGPITRAYINARLVPADCGSTVEVGAPIIKGMSGSPTLKVGETGKWQVKASDPQGGVLTYDVDWGDNGVCPVGQVCATDAKIETFTQTATFTHSYSNAGLYKVTIYVKNEAGKTASASVSVRVTKKGENPVGGLPSIMFVDNDSIKTTYNPAKPQTPFLDITFTTNIQGSNSGVSYVPVNGPVAFVLVKDGDRQNNVSVRNMSVESREGGTVVTGERGIQYYRLEKGEKMVLRLMTRYDTSWLFGGVYNGLVTGLRYSKNMTHEGGTGLIQYNLPLKSKLAIIGERAPYISRIESPVSPGEEMTITGERLNQQSNSLFIDGVDADGGPVNDAGTQWVITVPTLSAGRHSLYVTNPSWGKSNTVYFTVEGSVTPYCTNVWGDANQDGKLTVADAIFANDIYTGVIGSTGCSFEAADVNNDGKVTPADAQLISDRLNNVSVSVIDNVKIVGNQAEWLNQQTRKTITWNYSDVPLNKSNVLRFKVGLYSDLNGGMWGNSTSVPVTDINGTQSAIITAKVGRPWFNVKNYIRVRLVNADGTDYRPQGRRIESISAETFEVVADDSVTTYHPADINTDKRVVNSEMTEYCSKVGSTIDCYIAGEIWRRGEVYTYNQVTQIYLDAKGQLIEVPVADSLAGATASGQSKTQMANTLSAMEEILRGMMK